MTLIPKIFHRVWVTSNPMPAEYVWYGQKWLDLHPGWAMIHWTDWNLFTVMNKVCYDRATVGAMKCDILCVEALYKFGGVYLDCDMEPFKNIEPLLEQVPFQAYGSQAFAATEGYGIISGGIMGATAFHPAFADLVTRIPESINNNPGVGINGVTGPGFRTPILAQHGVTVFPEKFFYPYPMHEKHRKGEVFPEAYAAHHWGHSWQGAVA